MRYLKRQLIFFTLLKDSIDVEYWLAGVHFTKFSLQREQIKVQMKYDSISHRVTSSLLQLSLCLWNYVGRSWVLWATSVKTDWHGFGLHPKAHKQVFCQWATHVKRVSRWKYDCMVTSSVAHNLFIPNGPLNICFMFEVF